MDDRINKLPAWAREHISVLERDKEGLKAKLIALTNEHDPESDAPTVGDYMSALRGRALPTRIVEYPQIRCRVQLEKDREGEWVLNISGDKQAVVLPGASNALRIRFERHR